MKYDKQTYQRAKSFYQSLTPRQANLIDNMAVGYSNERLAQEMGLKEKTVKNHIRAAYRKLQPTKDEDPRAVAVMLWHIYHQHKTGE